MWPFGPSPSDRLLFVINYKVGIIMASQEQLAADLNALTAQVAHIGSETSATLQKVVELEAALAAAGATTPEVDAALAALKAQAQATDELVPDAAPAA